MSHSAEPREHPSPHGRFPLAPALLCVACVGTAAWCWMGYSYCWEVALSDLQLTDSEKREMTPDVLVGHRTTRPYVKIRGVYRIGPRLDDPDSSASVGLSFTPSSSRPPEGSRAVFVGRVVDFSIDGSVVEPILYAGASRFHGASIAGLVVGAMGIFIFALHLRRWLAERPTVRRAALEVGGAR
ncbi:MAG: hypothetical protein ACYS9X_03175 [Planctomycetota bacterium]|jgi:hypothetical protein